MGRANRSYEIKEWKISIIVPVYNVENYIEQCIKSILEQTYNNIEVILVNDGSTDRSGEICEHWAAKDKRITYIKQDNNGISSARNRGLDICSGEHILFVDSDDHIHPRMCERLLEIQKDTNADIVLCEAYIETETGLVQDKHEAYKNMNTQEFIHGILMDEVVNSVWRKLYKKELWSEVRFPEGIYFEDLYIHPQIFLKAKKIVYTPEPLYFYNRVNYDSATSKKNDFNAYLRYSKFKAYEEHERIGAEYGNPVWLEWGERKAVREIIKAVYINAGYPMLEDTLVLEMKRYLEKHETVIQTLNLKYRILARSIIRDWPLHRWYGILAVRIRK